MDDLNGYRKKHLKKSANICLSFFLSKLRIEDHFLNLLESHYKKSTANIWHLLLTLCAWSLRSGTKQGCLSSPLWEILVWLDRKNKWSIRIVSNKYFLKTYCKTLRHMKKIKSRRIDPHIYGKLVYDRGGIEYRKDRLFTKWVA